MSADATPTLFDSGNENLQSRIQELESDLKSAYAEQSRLNDLLHRHHSDQKRRDNEHDAATRREAWRAITHAPRHAIFFQAQQQFQALTEVVRSHACDDTAALKEAVAAFREAAESSLREDQIDMGLAGEIRWLRSYIQRAGQALHREFGDPRPPIGDRCRCAGCDLIVGTDLNVELPGGTEIDRSDLQQRVIDAENARDAALQRINFEQSANEQLRKTLSHRPVEVYQ